MKHHTTPYKNIPRSKEHTFPFKVFSAHAYKLQNLLFCNDFPINIDMRA